MKRGIIPIMFLLSASIVLAAAMVDETAILTDTPNVIQESNVMVAADLATINPEILESECIHMEKYQNYCQNSIGIVEYECVKGKIQRSAYDCPYGCKEGKCRAPFHISKVDYGSINKILALISKRFMEIESRLDKIESRLQILEKTPVTVTEKPAVEICNDQLDNDGDKWPDCSDNDCTESRHCMYETADLVCCVDGSNGICYDEKYDPFSSCSEENAKTIPIAGRKACYYICKAYGLDYVVKEEAIEEEVEEPAEEEMAEFAMPDTCGNGVCDENENVINCEEDCLGLGTGFILCGDGICDPNFEDAISCREDCGETEDYIRQKIKEWIQGLA